MKQYTIAELKKEFSRLGYKWLNFHIVGIRSKANAKNKFDDLIGIVNFNEIHWFNATTNAGTHWLKNLLNPKGCATLVPNQYKETYKIGLHQGKYKALVQVKKVSVYRDKNKNDISEEGGLIDTGLFGINIHRSNPNIVSVLIDKWSAGCQVLSNPKDFNSLLALCEHSGLENFNYTLFNEF